MIDVSVILATIYEAKAISLVFALFDNLSAIDFEPVTIEIEYSVPIALPVCMYSFIFNRITSKDE